MTAAAADTAPADTAAPPAVRWTVVLAVVLTAMPYSTWTAIAGSTIWIKLMLGFALSRHAHAKAKAVSQGR